MNEKKKKTHEGIQGTVGRLHRGGIRIQKGRAEKANLFDCVRLAVEDDSIPDVERMFDE